MSRSLFLLLLALPLFAADEAPKPRLRCHDEKPPVFTGSPFRPLHCLPGGREPARQDVEPAEASLPPKGGWAAALKGLDGRWRGLAFFGDSRYLLELEVSGSGRRWSFTATDYGMHVGHPLKGELKKPGWFSRGMPKLTVSTPSLPGESLAARLWLGKAPEQDGKPSAYAHAAVWKYSGRPELHRVEYTVEKERITASYTLTEAGRGPVGTTVELTRLAE